MRFGGEKRYGERRCYYGDDEFFYEGRAELPVVRPTNRSDVGCNVDTTETGKGVLDGTVHELRCTKAVGSTATCAS